MAADGTIDRTEIVADLERARVELHRLLVEAEITTPGRTRRVAHAGPTSNWYVPHGAEDDPH